MLVASRLAFSLRGGKVVLVLFIGVLGDVKGKFYCSMKLVDPVFSLVVTRISTLVTDIVSFKDVIASEAWVSMYRTEVSTSCFVWANFLLAVGIPSMKIGVAVFISCYYR